MPIEFWFDFASSYSYVAALRIERERGGVEVVYRPFLLGPLFHEQLGIKDSPFNTQPVRGQYMWRDVERLCQKYGLPWRKPSVFPRNSVLAARAALGRDCAFVEKVFLANFAEDRDIADPAVIAALGGDPAPPAGVKAGLRANVDEARRRQLFGAPSFTVGGELFFGQDRLTDALDWSRRIVQAPRGRAKG